MLDPTVAVLADTTLPGPLRWFMLCWIAFLGGCFGSFMNVVVYRLPRGQSVVHPPSACPACGHAIRWFHNLPVLGWLMLRGRCYDCEVKISSRYPIIEAIVMAMLVLLAWFGPLAGGANLPERLGQPLETLAQLWSVFAYHAILVCVLFCLAMIEFDGDDSTKLKPLGWTIAWTVLLGLVAVAIRPMLHPVSFSQEIVSDGSMQPILAGAIDALVGLGVGALLGLMTWSATRRGPMQAEGCLLGAGQLLLLGVFLGWQAVCAIAIATSAIFLVVTILSLRWPGISRIPWAMCGVAITMLWLVVWKSWIFWLPQFSASATGMTAIMAIAIVLVFSFTSMVVMRFRKPSV